MNFIFSLQVDVNKRVVIDQLPPVLMIALKRFELDYTTFQSVRPHSSRVPAACRCLLSSLRTLADAAHTPSQTWRRRGFRSPSHTCDTCVCWLG